MTQESVNGKSLASDDNVRLKTYQQSRRRNNVIYMLSNSIENNIFTRTHLIYLTVTVKEIERVSFVMLVLTYNINQSNLRTPTYPHISRT